MLPFRTYSSCFFWSAFQKGEEYSSQWQMPECVFFKIATVLAAFCLAITSVAVADDEQPPLVKGDVSFSPTAQEPQTAQRFRLDRHTFPYRFQPMVDFSPTIKVGDLRFPSAVETTSKPNNTVHCEYFCPQGEGPFPGVIVLHILGGDFALSRLFANTFAQHGVAALFLKMPYYGPRREPGNRRRMVSAEPGETVEGMTQAVLDIRRATAWLEARQEVDADRLGIFGISLGGITAALTATAESRLKNICLLLAGGDVAEVTWSSKETRKLREQCGV